MADDRTPPSLPPLLDYRPLDRAPRPTTRRILSHATCFAAILGGAVLIATSNLYASLVLTGFAFIVSGCFGLYALQPPPVHVPPVRYRLFSAASAASAIGSSIPLIIAVLFATQTGRLRGRSIGTLTWFIVSLVAYAAVRRLTTHWVRSHAPTDWTPHALRRRQIQIWSLAALTFLAICSVPGIVFCYDRISLHLDFRSGMAHALPTNQVVLTDDVSEAIRLQRSDPDHYPRPGLNRPVPLISQIAYRSRLLDRLGLDPDLFVHARQQPDQAPVLVHLTIHSTQRPDGTESTEFRATAYAPPTWRQSDWRVCSAARIPLPLSPSDRLRILAGQPDPADPARFTLPVQINDLTYTLAGTLDPTGQLRLAWADTPPAPPSNHPP